MPHPSFPDTPMVGMGVLGRNPDQTLVTHSRPRAARTCGQPAANAMESAPEITPILKEFPLCKKSTCARVINGFHTSRPWMWKTCFGRNSKKKDFFFPLLFLFLISTDFFSKGFKSDSSDCLVLLVSKGEQTLECKKQCQEGCSHPAVLIFQTPLLALLCKLDKSFFIIHYSIEGQYNGFNFAEKTLFLCKISSLRMGFLLFSPAFIQLFPFSQLGHALGTALSSFAH